VYRIRTLVALFLIAFSTLVEAACSGGAGQTTVPSVISPGSAPLSPGSAPLSTSSAPLSSSPTSLSPSGSPESKPNGSSRATQSTTTTSSYPNSVLADAPLAYYRLGETASTAADSSGNGNNGTYLGVNTGLTQATAGLLTTDPELSVTCNGSRNCAITAPRNAALEVSTVSLEAWVKLTNTGIYQSIAEYGDHTNHNGKFWGFAIKFEPSCTCFEMKIAAGGTTSKFVRPSGAGTNLSAGSVYHVVVTYDGSNGAVYLNGQQVASTPLGGAIAYNGTDGLVLVNNQGRDGQTYGSVQEIALYAKALSAGAVQQHYLAGTSKATPGPTPSGAPTPVPTSTPVATPTPTPGPVGTPPSGVVLMSAARIANAVGINTHVTETNVAGYASASKTLSLLNQIGVKHIRDGAQFGSSYAISWFNTMAGNGITADYIVPNLPSSSNITSWLNAVSSSVEAVEGVNEADGFVRGSTWPSQDAQSQATLYPAARSWNGSIPVLSPTITSESSARSLAAASPAIGSNITGCSMHNYSGWRNIETSGWGGSDLNAGYGSILYNENQSALYCGHGFPFYSTEVGWNNGLPEAVRARYIPRLYAYQTLIGVARTYMYALADDDGFGWGIFDSSANIKPSGVALSNYTKIYNDAGPASLTPLNYSISGASCNQYPSPNNGLKCLLAEKQDGSYLLGMWLSNESYNGDLHTFETVNPTSVTVSLATAKPVTVWTFNDDGSVTTTNLGTVSTIHYSATDHYGVLHIGP
jgi:concanavalin A-like lectin/glucanase superfamily protein